MSARRIKIRKKSRAKASQSRRSQIAPGLTKSRESGWDAARWLATGTLVAYTAVGSAEPALAQPAAAGSGGNSSQQQSLEVLSFDIPAGMLRDVIYRFEATTGVRVLVEQLELLDLMSPGVRGPMTPRMALGQLLEGTGVTYGIESSGRFVLEVAGSTFSVDVEDRVLTLSSPKYTSPLLNTPQTITVIPQSIIQQQGATTLTDALRNVPGLTMTAGEGGTPAGDNLTLRGFNARNNMFVDGVRDLSPQSRDPFNLEQVEVTKGPNSPMFGRGSAGGTINLVSKTANLNQSASGTLALGNASQRRASMDVNSDAPILGERTALRMNLLWHEGGVPGRNVVRNQRWGLAPTMTFGLGTPTRYTASYYKLKQDNLSDYGIPWVPANNEEFPEYRNRPAPVPRDTFYGYRDRDRAVLNQDSGTFKFEHLFSDDLTLHSQVRYAKSGRNSIATPPRFASTTEPIINREMRSWITDDRILDNQTDLQSTFFAGGMQHTVVTGTAFTRESQHRIQRSAPNARTSLFNPNPSDVYSGPITVSPDQANVVGNTQAVYAFDTVRMGSHWEANGGARWERFAVSGTGLRRGGVTPLNQTTTMTSVRAGVVFKPVATGSFYASYGTSLTPSLSGLGYQAAGTNIAPEKTYTTEAGVKWDLFGRRAMLTFAGFRVAKDNARTPGILPSDPPQVLQGRQITRGIEVSATGNLTRRVQILGGYTFVDARIRASNNPDEVGKYFINTPRHSASLWMTYAGERFTVGVGPRFMSKRYGNRTNERFVDGYATLDVMAGYTINEHWALRLNLTNANNAYYFDRLGGGHVVPAPGRGGLLTASYSY